MGEKRLERISKKQAIQLLRRSANRRKVNRTFVKDLVEEMNSGKWRGEDQEDDPAHVTGRTLLDGELLDGQHRLLAFVESKLEFLLIWVRYESTEKKIPVQRHRKSENDSDETRREGFYISPDTVSSATELIRIVALRNDGRIASKKEFREYFKHGMMWCSRMWVQRKKTVGSSSVFAAFSLAYYHEDLGTLSDLYNVLSGEFAKNEFEHNMIKLKDSLASKAIRSERDRIHAFLATQYAIWSSCRRKALTRMCATCRYSVVETMELACTEKYTSKKLTINDSIVDLLVRRKHGATRDEIAEVLSIPYTSADRAITRLLSSNVVYQGSSRRKSKHGRDAAVYRLKKD